jgi:hypothetical protein
MFWVELVDVNMSGMLGDDILKQGKHGVPDTGGN